MRFFFSFIICLLISKFLSAQSNLLLNGSFEDINVCTEYDAECGVEGWFYLRDIKAQMLANYDSILPLGGNSYGLYYKWIGYEGFTPVIGTILPCRLQKDKQYVFTGLISARLNGKLNLKTGITIDEKFFVPNRPFSKNMHPDTITQLKPLSRKQFYQFEYKFTATGIEKYLTIGTFIKAGETTDKKTLMGDQTVSLVFDNFQLTPVDPGETICNEFTRNKDKIYNYNFRHKEMDYSLFGKGDLKIPFDYSDTNYITRIVVPEIKPVKADTLKLRDVFFDFNKANLKPDAIKMLANYFKSAPGEMLIDSIYVEGHTDSIGTDKRNMELSIQRCESVMNWLGENSVASNNTIQIHPFGKTRPVATNSTLQGRALNRRVEMIIFRKSK